MTVDGTTTVDTPHGPARVVSSGDGRTGTLVLGHGAGGGVSARDLQAVAAVARSVHVSVALVEQPYRVAGRRSPPPAPRLDAAWTAVLGALRADELRGLPVVTGGRSSGARVACRTARATGAVGVLCLAFPLVPPRRSRGARAPTREPELDGVGLPTLVIQGSRDAFGMPPPAAGRTVVEVPGGHGLSGDLAPAEAVVRAWLPEVLA